MEDRLEHLAGIPTLLVGHGADPHASTFLEPLSEHWHTRTWPGSTTGSTLEFSDESSSTEFAEVLRDNWPRTDRLAPGESAS